MSSQIITLVLLVTLISGCQSISTRRRRQVVDENYQTSFWAYSDHDEIDSIALPLHNPNLQIDDDNDDKENFEADYDNNVDISDVDSSRDIHHQADRHKNLVDNDSLNNDENLVSIRDHLGKQHFSPDTFRPSVLRSIVEHPESLKVLPRDLSSKVLEDPIFKVSLQLDTLEKISKMLKDKGDELVEKVGEEAEDYDDYGFDYYDYEDQLGAVGSFLSDISPEFLATVSPDLIIGYLEGASPDDLKEILNNSTLLRNLPVETIGELLKKLPQDLIMQVINSQGVQELFGNTLNNTTAEEEEEIRRLQETLAPVIIKNLPADIISSLPPALIIEISNIETAVLQLFRESEKLELLIEAQPSLVKKINFDMIVKILTKNPELEQNISDELIIALLRSDPSIINKFPIDFINNLIKFRPWLVEDFPQETIDALADRHEVLFNLEDEDLMNLLRHRPSILKILINLPRHVLIKFLKLRSNLLDLIPKEAEPHLKHLVLSERFLTNLTPELLAEMAGHRIIRQFLNKYTLITILRIHPSLPVLIPDTDLHQFLHYLLDPWFRTRLPCSTISSMSENPEFVRSLPAEVLETIVTSKRMLSCIPGQNLENLLSQNVGLSRVSILGLLSSFSKLPSDKLSFKLIRLMIMEQAPEITKNLIFGEQERRKRRK